MITLPQNTAATKYYLYDKRVVVRYEEESVWLDKKQLAELFKVKESTVHEYLKYIHDMHTMTDKETGVVYYGYETIRELGSSLESVINFAFCDWAEMVIVQRAGK